MKKRKNKIFTLILISLFATLMCIGAWVHFPSPVPATMQTFVVFCSLGLLGSRSTFLVLFIYTALGIIGLPVFSGFSSGIGALGGPTAGFIWGFFLGIPVFYVFEKYFSRNKLLMTAGYILYILLHYIPGALWYCYFSTEGIGLQELGASLLVTVVPFIVPDAIKLMLAMLLTGRLKGIIENKFPETEK